MKKYLLIIILLTSCKTMYVPIETTRIENKDRFERDSIYLHDSIRIYEKGDSIFIDRWKYHFIDRIRVDSVFIRDSIPYPVEVVRVKEVNILTKWQKLKLNMFNYLVAIVVAFVAFVFIKKK